MRLCLYVLIFSWYRAALLKGPLAYNAYKKMVFSSRNPLERWESLEKIYSTAFLKGAPILLACCLERNPCFLGIPVVPFLGNPYLPHFGIPIFPFLDFVSEGLPLPAFRVPYLSLSGIHVWNPLNRNLWIRASNRTGILSTMA